MGLIDFDFVYVKNNDQVRDLNKPTVFIIIIKLRRVFKL